jgi:hypothetical protein
MVSKKDWKAWLQSTLYVALAAFLAVGFTFATFDTAAADDIPCAAPAWATEDSHIPQEAIELACALTPSTRSREWPAWATEDSHIPQEALDSIFTVAPATRFNSGDYFEAYLKALEQAENDRNAAFSSAASWDYANEMQKHAMSEGQ